MNRYFLTVVCLAWSAAGSYAHGQVVQLPTFHSFSVSTTVSVPDSGAAYLGGVTRGAWSSSSRGVPGLSHVPGLNRLFTNRGTGSSVSSSHAYATATVIDHDEMDRMLLSEAAARRGEPSIASETDRRAAYLSKFVARSPRGPTSRPPVSSEIGDSDLDSRLANANARHEAEMAAYMQRAEFAEAAGRLGAARCCYSALARQGNDAQKRFAAERLAAMESPATDVKLASRGD